jgi:hypothetical protein
MCTTPDGAHRAVDALLSTYSDRVLDMRSLSSVLFSPNSM